MIVLCMIILNVKFFNFYIQDHVLLVFDYCTKGTTKTLRRIFSKGNCMKSTKRMQKHTRSIKGPKEKKEKTEQKNSLH